MKIKVGDIAKLSDGTAYTYVYTNKTGIVLTTTVTLSIYDTVITIFNEEELNSVSLCCFNKSHLTKI